MTQPTTLEELKTARQTAGERYAAAIAEIEASYIELAAYDRALQMDRTLRGDLDILPVEMRHPIFGVYTFNFIDRVKAASDQLNKALSF